ncbi:hypothetical protein Calkr_2168 [Caldicellulosiruptor acetigenus I77R1B]|uniref:Uncharacterized protein n=1 Tax=Caldicellulosiruptor acetigenus (strain ATCC 700853 / DSM 12137 / I77R1B) TaxID=632335 RepID=E4S5X1_CALA7|nr:hypothetical protein [Caldicellulosiruptor acetigenus]ADQ41631.1 hypothetical protein Calkr_2168 [Caldicellulosiruptor acetigenus I77R1B]
MQNNNPNFNPFDVMVDIGECYAKVIKIAENEKELCSEPECIEDAEYMVVYEDSDEKVYLCKRHYDFIRTNTFCYVIENILDSSSVKDIPVVFGEGRKTKVSYIGEISSILQETEEYLKAMGLLENEEVLDQETFLTMLRSYDRVAYADVIGDRVFAYLLDEFNDEYVITEKEWEEIKQRLGE